MKGAAVTALEHTLTLDEIAQATARARVAGGGPAAPSPASPSTRAPSPRASSSWPSQGPNFDGHDFLAAAVETRRGRGHGPPRRRPRPPGCPLVRVARHHAGPEGPRPPRARCRRRVPVVAITGSAGKTTTKEMTAALLAHAGPRPQDGREPQQPVRPAPDPAAPDARAPVRGARARHVRGGRAARAVARSRGRTWPSSRWWRPSTSSSSTPWTPSRRPRRRSSRGSTPSGVAVLNWEDPRVRRIGEQRAGTHALVRPRPRLRRLRGELARHDPRHALRPAPGRQDARRRPAPARAALPAELPGRGRGRASPRRRPWTHRGGGHAPARPAKSRGQVRRLGEGVTLLDDSYNSNPAAVEAAVTALDMAAQGRRVAFLGDMLELGPDGPGAAPRDGREARPAAPTWWSAWARWRPRVRRGGARGRAGRSGACATSPTRTRPRADARRRSCSRATRCS